MKKQVLLIGALGGLATAVVKLLIQNGWFVYAADIQKEIFTKYEQNTNVAPLQIDITNEESIKDAFQLVSNQTSGLDAVINMAGVLKVGSMIELSPSELQNALEINLFGFYRVNQQFLPMLLERKGRIINLSSEVGRQTAAPFNGVYAISKHALEAYSDALRRELAFIGIKVIKIQPGPFKTFMTKNAELLFLEAQKNSVYFKTNLAKGISYLPKVYKNAHDPHIVAKVILQALESSNPKTAYPVKTDLSRMLLDKLPVKWADKLIKKVLS